jgi:cell division protease FtsH
MDGFEGHQGIVIIAATNRQDILDPALLRPGRFDRQVTVGNPDLKGREAILRVHARKINMDPAVDSRSIARGTPGFSGADLANLVNEAALFAGRASRTIVTNADMHEARDKVLMGVERRSVVLSELDRVNCAYHEAGHAVVAALLPKADPLHKVTIIPRGRAMGVTMQLPEADRHTYTKDYLETQVAVLMGGRVAEELFMNHMTSGASNDIERATDIAQHMVCEWGMSELGPLAFRSPATPTNPTARTSSARRPRSAWTSRFARSCWTATATAKWIIEEEPPSRVDMLAKELLEVESLERRRVEALLTRAGRVAELSLRPEGEGREKGKGRTASPFVLLPFGLLPYHAHRWACCPARATGGRMPVGQIPDLRDCWQRRMGRRCTHARDVVA